MKRVLIIEDNEDNLYLVKFMLEQKQLEVMVAETGIKGYELAMSTNPDLILMDIQLPDVNGMEVTRMIRESDQGKEVPIIAITSYAMTGDREKALQAGCTGYIEKPIDPETFLDTVNQYLK